MKARSLLVLGAVLATAGVVIITAGIVSPSKDIVVALGWLLFAPLLAVFVGGASAVVGLCRTVRTANGPLRKIVAAGCVAGAALAGAIGAAGVASQVGDWASGANGAFIPGPAAGEGALMMIAAGLVVGAAIGAIASVTWWSTHRASATTGA